MKKKTKILSISLAFLMSCGVMHTAIFSGYAQETTSQSVASEEKSVESVAVTKLPDKTEYTLGKDTHIDFRGLELSVTDNVGNTQVYTNTGDYWSPWVDSEGNSADDFECSVLITPDSLSDLVVGDNTITVEYMGFTDEFTLKADEVFETKWELTKLPDKVFDAPIENFIDTELPDYGLGNGDCSREFFDNAVSQNMKGAEFTVYYSNGETEVFTLDHVSKGNEWPYAPFWECSSKTTGDTKRVRVAELGNYQAEIGYGDFRITFTAKNHNTPVNPDPAPTVPDTTPTNPEQPTTAPNQVPPNPEQPTTAPSQETTNSEQPTTKPNTTSTPSEVVSDSVKTGSDFYCIAVISIMLGAMGVFLFFNRERYFNK